MTTIQPAPTTPLPNRREFLYYLAGGALLLTVGGGVALTQRFLQEQLREGIDFIYLDIATLPAVDTDPIYIFDAPIFVSRSDAGASALDSRCTFEASYNSVGITLHWDDHERKFKCPLCGSHFALDGDYLAGPARRNMDQYVLMAQTARGSIETPPDGAPLPLDGVRTLAIDLRRVIYGAGRGS
jgi:cytochrome b6-f complex iron-sulfur subunit